MSVNDLDYRGSINYKLIRKQLARWDATIFDATRILICSGWIRRSFITLTSCYDESQTGSASERRILNNFSLLFFRDKMLSSLQFYAMWSFAVMRDAQWRSMEGNLIIEKFSEEEKTHKPFQNFFSFLIN